MEEVGMQSATRVDQTSHVGVLTHSGIGCKLCTSPDCQVLSVVNSKDDKRTTIIEAKF